MLIYVDDVVHIAENPQRDMVKLGQIYCLKDGVGTPDRYLGGNIQRVQTSGGSVAWSLSCYDYLTTMLYDKYRKNSVRGASRSSSSEWDSVPFQHVTNQRWILHQL